jgi:F-type H+-transporting ATPase subunit delta
VIQEVAAKRYAEAAYLIAREDGKLDEWSSGLTAVSALYGEASARAFFESARVPPAQKRETVEKSLKDVDDNVRSLALLLLRRNRTHLGPQIAEAYREILDAANGISHAIVTSAVPLSGDEEKAVRQKLEQLTGGTVVMQTETDESILGGLVVRIGDRLIDGSTRSRLQALKQRLEGARA